MRKLQPRTAKIIKELDKRIHDGEFDATHGKTYGIRSRQIAALLQYLIDKGVLR